MTSYFDHFVVIQIISCYITDLFVIALVGLVLYMVINVTIKVIPDRFQTILEGIIVHWEKVVSENLGEKNFNYFILLLSLFLFIFGLNLLGFFTYTFPLTTHIFITFGLSLGIWLGVIILGFYNFRGLYLSSFMPLGAPLFLSPFLVVIEMISNLSRPIALGMRLAANLTAGHILMAILGDFGSKLLILNYGILPLFPVLVVIFMTILEVGVLVIQAYVFCLLSVIYLRDSISLH